MKTINKFLCLLPAILLLLAGASCSDDDKHESSLELDALELSVNKRGVTNRGQSVTVQVTSNIYWTLSVSEEDDWIEADPVAGYGSTSVTLTVSPNNGEARQGTVVFETSDGLQKELTLKQNGADEEIVYFYETCGEEPVSDYMVVSTYNGWISEGISFYNIRFRGDWAYVSSDQPSTTHHSVSGGNNIYLPDNTAEFNIQKVETFNDYRFLFQFSVYDPQDERKYKVLMNDGGNIWPEMNLTVTPSAGEWKQVSSEFSIIPGIEQLFFRFMSTDGEARFDDFGLYEGSEDAPLFEFVETLIFYDDFSWATGGKGTAVKPYPWASGTDGYRFDDWPTNGIANPGWTSRKTDHDTQRYIWSRAGHIKIGKTKVGGNILSPPFEKISGTRDVDVTVRVLPWGGPENDLRGIKISVEGGGWTEWGGAGLFDLDTDFTDPSADWTDIEFTIFDATSSTQVFIEPAWSDEDQKAYDRSNRYFIDEFNVVISTKDRPDVSLVKGLPAGWLLTAGKSGDYSAAFKSNHYVMCNIEGMNPSARVSYVVVDASDITRPAVTYNVGSTGHPYVGNAWIGDHWLFTVPVNNLYAGARLKVKLPARVDEGGLPYWILEYRDGTDWLPLGDVQEVPTQTGVYYNAYLYDGSNTPRLEETFTLANAINSGNLQLRLRLVSNIDTAGNALSAPVTKAARIASWNTSDLVISLESSEVVP